MSFVIGILQNKILLIKDSQQDMFLQCTVTLASFIQSMECILVYLSSHYTFMNMNQNE